MGFRREYNLNYRDVLAEMWWVDIAILIEGLGRWTRTDENIARLVDREDYWLNSEYSQWITDPDDPDVKAEQARRKALGIKPPPRPIMWPVASRPPEIDAELLQAAITASEKASEPPRKKISVAELQNLMKGE